MQLAFRKFGEGTPLLILHGLFGQSDNWNTLAKRFAERGFCVYAIDLRNHGLSPHSNDWSNEVMADDLAELIRNEGLSNSIVLGHSMGGKTAMCLALKYPHLLSKLIVADISPNKYTSHHNEVIKALKSVDFNVVKNRKEAEAVLSHYISDFGTKQFLLKNIYWKDAAEERMDWRFNLSVIAEKYDEILKEVPHLSNPLPTLFVRGDKSAYIEDSDLPAIEERFPNYTLKTVANSGHWIHAEQPDAFFNVVMDFIKIVKQNLF